MQKLISLQETFNFLYKGTSSGEKGTLFQLRNRFDRRGVKSEVLLVVSLLHIYPVYVGEAPLFSSFSK